MENELMVTENIGGVVADFDLDDLTLERATIVHGTGKMSDELEEQGARKGEIWTTESQEKLGDNENPLKLIVLDRKRILITETNTSPPEVISTEPYSPSNANYKREDVIDGRDVKRYVAHDFYFVRCGENIDSDLPYVIRLKKTSTKTARRIMTDFARLAKQGKSSLDVVLELSTKKQSNDQHSWYVLDYNIAGDASDEEKTVAHTWFTQMQRASAQVTEEDIDFS